MADKTLPAVSAITVTPNPIAKNQTFTIAVLAVEKVYREVINPEFEFELESMVASAPDLSLGEITYVPDT